MKESPENSKVQTAITTFTAETNNENIMDGFINSQMGKILLFLQEKYHVYSDNEKNVLVNSAINNFEIFVNNKNDHKLKTAWNYLKQRMETQELNHQRDRVVVHYKINETAIISDNINHEDRIFYIQEAFALVFTALQDNNIYFSGEEINTNLENLCGVILEIFHEDKCSVGVRNQLIYILNEVYPDIKIVVDPCIFAHNLAINYITSHIEKTLFNNASYADLIRFFQEEDSDDPAERKTFISVVKSEKMNLKSYLDKAFLEAGVNPFEYPSKDNIEYFLFPPEELASTLFISKKFENKTIQNIFFVLALQKNPDYKSSNLKQKAADAIIKFLISQNDLTINDEFINHYLTLFVKISILEIYYQKYLSTMKVFASDAERHCLDMSAEEINTYYNSIITNLSSNILAYENFQHIPDQIEKLCDKFIEETYSVYIENIFTNWKLSSDKASIYKHLSDKTLIATKFRVSDKFLAESFSEQIRSSQTVDITVYIINRMFLYAVFTPVSQWGEKFFNYFTEILQFIQTNMNNASEAENLRKNSYPHKFLAQLNYMKEFYLYNKNSTEMSAPIFKSNFYIPPIDPSLYQTNEQLITILKFSSSETQIVFIKNLMASSNSAVFEKCVPNPADAENIMDCLSNEAQEYFVDHLPEHFIKKFRCQTNDQLTEQLKSSSSSTQLFFLKSLIISLKSQSFKEGSLMPDKVNSIIECLFPKARIFFTHKLTDLFLQGYILLSNQIFTTCLKFFSHTERLNIIYSLKPDMLKEIVQHSEDIDNIMNCLSFDTDKCFIQQMLKWFLNEQISLTNKMISKCLKALTQKEQVFYIDQLQNFLSKNPNQELSHILNKILAWHNSPSVTTLSISLMPPKTIYFPSPPKKEEKKKGKQNQEKKLLPTIARSTKGW